MEWLDLVDAADQVIGATPILEYHGHHQGYIRCAVVFLVNQEGRVWIPKRALCKRIFPGALDASVSGHVQRGESYLAAAQRETLEESGLDLPLHRFESFAYLEPPRDQVFAFSTLYLVALHQETPRQNPLDHNEVVWMLPTEALHTIREGTPSRPELPLWLEKLHSTLVSLPC